MTMFGSYVKVALRNLARHKVYSLLNIAGLAHGLACCLLIVAFILFECSFDQFHTNGKQIYRMLVSMAQNDNRISAAFPAGIDRKIYTEIGEVQSVVRVAHGYDPLIKYQDKLIQSSNFLFVDSTFLTAFSFPLLRGDSATALRDPSSLIITETAAKRLFGDSDPIGQTVTLNNKRVFTVSAVAKDCPRNSHLWFEYLAPFHGMVGLFFEPEGLTDMVNWNYGLYLQFKPGVDGSAVAARLPEFVKHAMGDDDESSDVLQLQPLSDVHFSRLVTWENVDTIDPRYLQTLGAIGLVILFIAVVNFMNLSTARSLRRAREVGLRKVLGTHRSQLMLQFLGESLMVAIIAIPLAVAFAELMLPMFQQYVRTPLELITPLPLLAIVALALIGGLLGGLYPAIYLSNFKPIAVLKGKFHTTKEGLFARRMLIVLQYGIATVLMVATLVVMKQFNYMRTADPGYKAEQLVLLSLPESIAQSYDSFRERLLANPQITGVARSAQVPGWAGTSQTYFVNEGSAKADTINLNALIVDEEFVPTFGLKLLQGRNFSKATPTDETESYLVNASAAKQFGWDEPIGQSLRVWSRGPGKVIGMVEDFHFRPMTEKIEPVVLRIERSWYNSLFIRLAPGAGVSTMDFIKERYTEVAPDVPFSPQYHDQSLARLYGREERLSNMLAYLTGAAILIASLGLFGLASYSAEQRIKELGVRKVLGANTGQLVQLLIRQFTLWVLVAVLIASPIAYYVAGKWLHNFAYRVSIGWDVFAATIAVALVVAILTVIFQAIRAARMNPSDALRYE
jgi:putative ABC transport system permease protein